MRRTPLFLMLAAGAALSLAPAHAAGGQLPKITGGGHTQNNNSGGPDQTGYGGFVAQATEEAESSGDGAEEAFLARGQVQARSVDSTTRETVGKVHGEVVCIANYGPADAEDGGRAGSDVWEIRFEVTRSDPALPLPPNFGPAYASIMVQDGGREDYVDESFESSLLGVDECGHVTEFQLEPHQGQITVHD